MVWTPRNESRIDFREINERFDAGKVECRTAGRHLKEAPDLPIYRDGIYRPVIKCLNCGDAYFESTRPQTDEKPTSDNYLLVKG